MMNLLAAASTTPLWVVLGYLVLLLGLGIYSSRFFKGTSRDYFVASRSIGSFLLLMSVFGTTMTGFALVGSTGESFERGIAVYGAMASWSGLIHSAIFFLVGIRLWAIGKRNGYVTQVQFFRDRFQSPALGYVLFAMLVVLVIPYLLIGIISAGKFVQPTTAMMFDVGWLAEGIPPWLTGLVICGVVLTYVFLGGVRSAAWANAFQAIVFMVTGIVAFLMISHKISHDIAGKKGGFLQNIHDATKYVEKQEEARHKLVRGIHAQNRVDYQEKKKVYRDELNNYAGALESWGQNTQDRLDSMEEHAGEDKVFQLSEFKGLEDQQKQVFGLLFVELADGNRTQQQTALSTFPDFNATHVELKKLHDDCLKKAKIDSENDEDFEAQFEADSLLSLKKPSKPTEPTEPSDTMPHLVFLTFLFIPLSVGMFPHVFQHWLTAKSAKSFRLSIIAHPICIAIVWLPCVLIGVWAAGLYAGGKLQLPMIPGPDGEMVPNSSAVLGTMVSMLVQNPLLTGLLMAGVLAAIMSSLDSQFICLGTMFTNDIFLPLVDEHDYTDRKKVWVARLFTVAVVVLAYGLSLVLANSSVFSLGIWCFTGFAGLVPLVIAALYWRRVTTAGAFACVAVTGVLWLVLFKQSDWGATRDFAVFDMLPAAPITLASATALVIVSFLTKPPSGETLRKFFPPTQRPQNNNPRSSEQRKPQRNQDRRSNSGNRNRGGNRSRR
ncbi:MAG: sodium:solute symporter family protein [Verrucomicrobiota bacterium]|jgi:SSS family solute:Na+ symporter|nr:sodium:solute symporter family protein [Verrucomicrobiota bacterium]